VDSLNRLSGLESCGMMLSCQRSQAVSESLSTTSGCGKGSSMGSKVLPPAAGGTAGFGVTGFIDFIPFFPNVAFLDPHMPPQFRIAGYFLRLAESS